MAMAASDPALVLSSKGDAESGRLGKLGRTQPGSAIHQGLKAGFLQENTFKLRTHRRKSGDYFYGIFHGIFSINHPLKALFWYFI